MVKYHLSIKGTVMQIDKALINDRLRVSKVSRKSRIPCSNLPEKFAIFLKYSIVFSVYKQNFTAK